MFLQHHVAWKLILIFCISDIFDHHFLINVFTTPCGLKTGIQGFCDQLVSVCKPWFARSRLEKCAPQQSAETLKNNLWPYFRRDDDKKKQFRQMIMMTINAVNDEDDDEKLMMKILLRMMVMIENLLRPIMMITLMLIMKKTYWGQWCWW